MSTIDETGLNINTFDETKESLEEELKSVFGDNIDLSDDSVFGQLVSIISERVSDQNEIIQVLANINNVNAAYGVFLSNAVLLNNISRNATKHSTVLVTITALDAPMFIPAATSRFQDPTIKEPFKLVEDLSLNPLEAATVAAIAVNEGAIKAEVDTLTEIVTPQYGWGSVTNPEAATIGNLEETDASLRQRRAVSVADSNLSYIKTSLLALDDVTACNVSTPSTGVIESTLIGGTSAAIAEELFDIVSAGTHYAGTTTVSHYDAVTDASYDIKFNRATDIIINIIVNITKVAGYPGNGDELIKENIVKYFDGGFLLNGALIPKHSLGDNVVSSQIYTAVNAVQGQTINAIYIARNPDAPTSTDTIIIDGDEVATTNIVNIEVVS